MTFYRCAHCGNIITKLTDAKVPVVCCGEPMQALKAGSVDAAVEKHVPAVQVQANIVNVTVGEVEHPMLAEHWICLLYTSPWCWISCCRVSAALKCCDACVQRGTARRCCCLRRRTVWKTV